ncbi:hypothetical protein [uncultured Marixanthomonas sp.]|uniref:hypothetical protein n=1 Tax=uncultured Marixanthomonas sp. TaxID=757245 RepID=UPI0030D84D80|tara:strand:- start:7934 stop:8479 length:546 start_codon:yes stop_codon:yes gene_type:complete
MSETIKILLASGVIAGIVSAIISYLTSIRLKKMDFRNEYYKEILKKRLNAYEFIENQIAVMKSVVLDDDGKPFHLIFGQGESKFYEFQQNLMLAISYGLWIDNETHETLDEINNLFFNLNNHVNKKNDSVIEEIGKKYYNRVSELRMKLEKNAKKGLYDLHDIKKVFKSKKRNKKRIIYKE